MVSLTAAGRPSVFLHTGWRSRGTWIWASLRDDPNAMGFYEPMHEGLATVTPAAILANRPDSWDSGHSMTSPYWVEFLPLLHPNGVGVSGYEADFATKAAFATPGNRHQKLKAYLQRLLNHAACADRVPVLKFCRSLGSVGWMRAHFPDAMHVVVLRRPSGQWASIRRKMEKGNDYFLARQLLALALNTKRSLVAGICDTMSVAIPKLDTSDPHSAWMACRSAVQEVSWSERHRVFMAYWIATTASALKNNPPLIDADLLVSSETYRADVAESIGSTTGLKIRFSDNRDLSARYRKRIIIDEPSLQYSAMSALKEFCVFLPPELIVLLICMLVE